MKAKFEELTVKMRTKGYVTEKEYDEAGIVDVNKENRKPKDEKTFSHNRAMLLNTDINIKRYNDNPPLSSLAPVDRAAFKQAKAEEKTAEKKKQQEEIKRTKEEAKAKKHQEKKEAEENKREAPITRKKQPKRKRGESDEENDEESLPLFLFSANRDNKRQVRMVR